MKHLCLLFKYAMVVLLTVTLHVFVNCSGDGGDISVVDNKITGMIRDTSDTPAEGVSVYLRPHDFLPVSSQLGKRMNKLANGVCSTSTDANGEFNFTTGDSIAPGEYVIEAVADGGKNKVLVGNIVLDSVLLHSRHEWLRIDEPEFETTLKPSATISGKVIAGGKVKGSVMVAGLDVSGTITDDGSYALVNVPAGNLQVIIQAGVEGWMNFVDTIETTVVPGESRVFEKPYRLTYWYYSARGIDMTVTDPNSYAAGDSAIVMHLSTDTAGFIGWNTLKGGYGTMYQPGDTFIISKDTLVLFGIWENDLVHRLVLLISGSGDVEAAKNLESETNTISATPDSGFAFVKWNVIEGEAVIESPESLTTSISLKSSYVRVEAIFERVSGSFYGVYTLDSLFGYCSNESFASLQLSDGSFVVSGSIYEFDNSATQSSGTPALSHVYLIKINQDGVEQWKKVFKNPTGHSKVYSIIAASDNGFVLAGETTSDVKRDYDMLIMKTDKDGNLEWTRSVGGSGLQRAEAVVPVNSGGYLVCGTQMDDYNATSLSIVRIQPDGSVAWEKSMPELNGGNAIFVTGDSTFLIPAVKEDDASGGGIHLVAIAANGTILYDTVASPLIFEKFLGAWQATDGTLNFVGNVTAEGMFMVRVPGTTGTASQMRLTDITTDLTVNSVHPLNNGGFVMTGERSTLIVAKVNDAGKLLWEHSYGVTGVYNPDYGNTVIPALDGGYFVAGQISFAVPEKRVAEGVWPVMVIKTDAAGMVK